MRHLTLGSVDEAVGFYWQDIQQLWVQTPAVDFTLTDRVRGMDGIHAQWAMDRDLAEYSG